MAVIHDNVFDAALAYVSTNVNKVQLRAAGSSVLVSHASSGSDIVFGAPTSHASGGGREITALSGGLSSIGVSTGGAATKGALLNSSTVLIVASTASTYSLGSSDTVNFQAFTIALKDPV